MKEPSPRSSRLALAAGLVAAITVGGGGFVLGQRSVAGRAPVAIQPPVAAPKPVSTPSPRVDRPLGRSDLITLASTAADATARGATMPQDIADAVGKRFAMTLPFGCSGPADEGSEAAMRWRYDEDAGALRLHVAPVTWSPAEWWPQPGQPDEPVIEGFWINRPWTNSETCPPASEPVTATGADPVTLSGQTLAIGQLFGGDGARLGRRDGKAYTAVIRMPPDAVRAGQGFRLRVGGRIAATPDGSSATCRQPGGAEQRPICMITTILDQVMIENATTGDTLATWTVAEARP